MKKLLLLLFIVSTYTYSQEVEYTDVPYEMYGVYRSVDNEFLKIYSNLDGKTLFQRVDGRKVVAKGEIKRVGNELRIIRLDYSDEYNLIFVIGNGNMVITKPRSDQAWLWDKIQ